MTAQTTFSERFFLSITRRPKTYLTLGLMLIALCAAFIPTLKIDPTAESFLPDDHAARVYRDKVEKDFGITDPMVIAIKNDGPHGIFNPQTLSLVQWLTDEVNKMPAIDSDGVISLATEDNITGTDEGMLVEPFMEHAITTQAQATQLQQAIAK